MCLIAFAWQSHPDYPLIVAANRDEFLARPASPAHWWTDAPGLLAGRDLQAGGSWMGLSASGRFAALTNYRDPSEKKEGAPSRGALVRNMLESDEPPIDGLRRLAAGRDRYPAFNLLAGDAGSMAVLESRSGVVRTLEAGVYGLSNHLLDSPWPKLVRTRSGLAKILAERPDEDTMKAGLLALLRDPTQAAEAQLPFTGVSAEWERLLSAAFIRAPGYGTRCSSIVLVDTAGNTSLHEWTWKADGGLHSEVLHRFTRRPPHPRDA